MTHTPTQIAELNSICAEKVMQWTKALKMSQIEKAGEFCVFGEEIYIHERGSYVKKFHPTTNDADAFAVLKKCAEKMKAASVRIAYITNGVDSKYLWKVWTAYRSEEDESATAETLNLAIVKFAIALHGK